MERNIVFVGGIHGVGKSTVCNKVVQAFNVHYLSASSVIKWEEINEDIKNKKVQDIPHTQDRLINGLRATVTNNNKYLLDGHLCLFDGLGQVTKVPMETFEAINPMAIVVIVGDPKAIRNRLVERDNKNYSLSDLIKMQDDEINYGKAVAAKLGVKCIQSSVEGVTDLLTALGEFLK